MEPNTFEIAGRLRHQSDEYWGDGTNLVRASEADDDTSTETRETWREAGKKMLEMADLLKDAALAIERLNVEAQDAEREALRLRLALQDARDWLRDLGSTTKADHINGVLLKTA